MLGLQFAYFNLEVLLMLSYKIKCQLIQSSSAFVAQKKQ